MLTIPFAILVISLIKVRVAGSSKSIKFINAKMVPMLGEP